MHNTLLLGVIYPGVEKYIKDYCNSIKIQDTKGFDILILNDKYNESFQLNDDRITILNIENNLTPSEIRMLGIKYAINNKYEYIVFSDSDDYFSSNRISLSKEKLKKCDFVYNDCILIDRSGGIINKYRSSYFKIRRANISISDIIDKNIIGFGNSGVKVKKIDNLYIPIEIIAVDWWIYSILLLNSCKGGYISKAINYYRQHKNNFGISTNLNKKKLLNGIRAKQIHYKNLLIYCKDCKMNEATKIYFKKLEEINTLNKYIQDDSFCRRYIEVINKNFSKIYNGWWSEILPINEWRKYDE